MSKPVTAQNIQTDVNTIRELAIAMKLGFENMERQRQSDREYLEKLIQANKELIQANRELIQANREALEKRIAFLENLMLALITIVLTQIVYVVWNDRKNRPATQPTSYFQKTVPLQEFEKLLKRVQELESQRA